jgi:two-component system response regulator AtoC
MKYPVARILIVDDEPRIHSILTAVLTDEGYQVDSAADGIEALQKAPVFKPDLILTDLQMPRMDGIETITRIRELLPHAVCVILTAHGSFPTAVQAIKQGAYDYLTKPFDNEQLLLVVRRGVELARLSSKVNDLEQELKQSQGIDAIIGESPAIHDLRRQIRRIAGADTTVLIEGESGTGKELVARAIHFESQRCKQSLVVVDCASVPASLIESEFFGHEKGAFTDAADRRIGKFEEAHTGTIFLDEIGELPLESQVKLLRVLQEKEFTRVGGNERIGVDVRVIAATNRHLEQLVQQGTFRQDLFYRLNVMRLYLMPLREREEDIPVYARHFLDKHQPGTGRRVAAISDEAFDVLMQHSWKGNVRELENAIQRVILSADSDTIQPRDFEFLKTGSRPTTYDPVNGLEPYVRSITEKVEREVILDALNRCDWNRTAAAEKLKLPRRTLFEKMRLLDIQPPSDATH